MSDLSGNYGRQQTVLDNGLPYPKPIEEEAKDGNENKKEQLKRASGFKKTSQEKTKEKKEKEKAEGAEENYVRRSPIRSWFNTFMIMNIPIIGWFYLLILALRKDTDQRRDFARAYLVYKLVFFLVALGILIVLMYTGMEMADRLLRYMNML